MNYSLFLTARAIKDLGKLPKSTALRIINKLESITDEPYRTVERCEGYPYYHQRIGVYRAILEIDDSGLVISIVKIGLRKKVYHR